MMEEQAKSHVRALVRLLDHETAGAAVKAQKRPTDINAKYTALLHAARNLQRQRGTMGEQFASKQFDDALAAFDTEDEYETR